MTGWSRAVAAFLRDPVGAARALPQHVPSFPQAAMALLAATLVMVVIDYIWGPRAFPHTLEPGGKRDGGIFDTAALEVTRIYGCAAMIYVGARLLGNPVPMRLAFWMTLPYALALVAFEGVQMGTWIFALATGIDLYGQFYMMGFLGSVLVLVVSLRGLLPERDWLGVLPLAVAVYVGGTFLAPIVLIGAGLYWLVVRKTGERA